MIFEITLLLDHNNQILNLVDKNYNNFYINDYCPNHTIEWWKSTVNRNSKLEFDNLEVRNMRMDIQTDFKGLKQLTKKNNHLSVFQFDKRIPDTFDVNQLFQNKKYEILKKNKLKHWFITNYEFTTIGSFDEEFVLNIKHNTKLTIQ